MDPPATGESVDQEQPAAADVLGSSRPDLTFEPGALVDNLAADNLIVELKPEGDFASSMKRGVSHEFRDHEGELAQSFRADIAVEISLRGGASQTGGGRVRRQARVRCGLFA